MNNPFRYGTVATGEYFTDRVQEARELEDDLRAGQDVVVISPRRFGKTSLIQTVLERLRGEGLLTAYVDLYRVPTKDHLVRNLANALFRGIESPLGRSVRAAADLFRKLSVKPSVSMDEEGRPVLELTPAARAADLDRDIERLLELPQEIAGKRKSRVILAFDEFQEATAIDPNLPRIMRSVFQHQDAVTHVYLGSKYHLMHQLFNDRNQPFYQSAKHLPLGPLPEAEFAAFIGGRFACTGTRISREAIERILEITGCQPNDTQELCHFVWARARADAADASIDAVEGALRQILAAESARYQEIWDGLPPTQRALLLALAAQPGKALGEEYRRAHSLGSPTTVQRARERLVQRQLIEMRSGGDYQVPDVFFRFWLQEMRSAAAE